jgi:general nucleoside transport system ATP-binding protein
VSTPAAVELRHISKRFGAVQALSEVDLDLRWGEVHALVGENGAGKTTLMNVLAGLYQPDAGAISLGGRQVDRFASPGEALRHGIGMVHQHFELVAPFTALDNVVLGHEGGWRTSAAARRAAAGELMQRYRLPVDLDARVRDVSIGVQQKIEILKALYRGVRLLILDEPTTHLTPQEVADLFATVRQLARGGLSVVLITHKLREILDLADRVTVMRRGRAVATLGQDELGESRLVELLMGTSAPPAAQPAPVRRESGGAPVLELSGPRVQLRLLSGELFGIAGVAGNGQVELAETLVGLRPLDHGRLVVAGRDVTHADVRARLLAGVAYVPEDRLRDGILPHLPVAETLFLGPHLRLFGGSWRYDPERVRAAARRVIADYGIATAGPDAPTAHLSGGNLQKLLVARALSQTSAGPVVLIALNPTRGLDLATTTLVQQRLVELCRRGGAVLLVSEDLDELLRLCDRIAVMYRGRLSDPIERPAFDPYRIGSLMLGAGV